MYVQNVVIKSVLFIPQRISMLTAMIHRVRYIYEVLPEFTRDILVRRLLDRELERDGEHVEAVHRHPARAVGLGQFTAGRQRLRTVEDTDVVEPEKTAFENVVSLRVLAVDPPGEVKEQLLKY